MDPLQLGTYARSIATIAEQIGLPNRFVELRHAATHEDLPSLELLRTAASEVMPLLQAKIHLYLIFIVIGPRLVITQLLPTHPLGHDRLVSVFKHKPVTGRHSVIETVQGRIKVNHARCFSPERAWGRTN